MDRRAGFDAEHHGVVFFELANIAKGDVVGKPGHERRAKSAARKIPGAESRENKKQDGPEENGAESKAEGSERKRAMEAALVRAVRGQNGE